ncbi:MAG: aldose 1-epimerase family protein [Lactobacillus sp.]|nr:aldose 1-epimerase family protein [Lactobacillus sp.]
MINEYQIADFLGRLEQLNGVHAVTFNRGKARGMQALRVYTQAGLSLLITPDRGLDIPELKVRGNNIAFMASPGLVNSTYFVEDHARGFMRNFTVGFLTTGGLSYMGAAPVDSPQGLHGVIANTPAENFDYVVKPELITITGDVREAEMFGPNLILHRCIKIATQANVIEVHDVVENQGPQRQSLMMLYHTNFGYPFFSPATRIDMKPTSSYYRSGVPTDDWNTFTSPQRAAQEVVYYHDLPLGRVIVKSPTTGLQLKLTYSRDTLPVLNQWKLQQTHNYVLGIEPATNNVNGFDQAKKEQTLEYLEPGEQRTFDLSYEFTPLEGK